MSDHPFAYYDPLHDKLLWAEGPSYVHAQRTEGMSLKPLYLHPPRQEPARKPMNGDEVIEEFCKADISGLQSFTEGVRCAEEFHGIGGDDE